MVTPFDENGALNLSVAVDLARWLVEQGNDGLVVCGTTGEGPTLTDAEKLDLWRTVSEAVTVPVVAGSGSNDTAHSVELTKAASQTGVAGILAVTPYYNRPPQRGIELHFRAIADATELPVMLYDIPIRSGRKIAHETMLTLAREVSNIVAVKDATSDLPAASRFMAEAPSQFELYSGEDAMTLALMTIGASGTVGVATHWSAKQHGEMLSAYIKGDVNTAERLNAGLLPSFAFESGDAAPNPIPVKAMMRTLGFAVGECRLPMGPAPEGIEARAREIYANLPQ